MPYELNRAKITFVSSKSQSFHVTLAVNLEKEKEKTVDVHFVMTNEIIVFVNNYLIWFDQ